MLVDSVLDVFGPQALAPALALRHASPLRFALSGEDESVSMFLQALDRARVLTDRVFEGSTQAVVICTVYDVADIHTTQRALQRSRRRLGVPGLKWGDAVMKAEENDEAARVFLPFVMDAASVPNLLWSMLAREVGVRLNQLAHEFRAWRLNLRP